jgi:UDP-N-acetylglucosamine/UDP-N-acetylgalactosamine diphosphorylase
MRADIAEKLKRHKQDHILRIAEGLPAGALAKLESQLEIIDFEEMDKLIAGYVLRKPDTSVDKSKIHPAPYYPAKAHDAAQAELYKKAASKGAELVGAGKVALLTVAGGQGTRLGFDAPKGLYPITPVKGKTFFQYFSEETLALKRKHGIQPLWFIMTSGLNDAATKAFFEKNSFFGLDRERVIFFTQGTMPAIGLDGKLLMASPDSLALSPDGHGGTLLALRKSGALKKMASEGVEYISYFQIDNPLVPPANPLFIGLHSLDNAEMSAIMLAKTGPFEKLGNFCMVDSRLNIIEYSDMPEELATSKNPDGSLKFIAGSPAIHIISRAFVERLTKDGVLKLPWHRADKKVPCLDAAGKMTSPSSPNAVKLESFIFDALPLAERTMILEGERRDVFAPTKNPSGVDSVESCRLMLTDRDSRRLERAGLAVPRKTDGSPDCVVELSPLTVFDDCDCAAWLKASPGFKIKPGEKVYIG